MNWVIVDQFLVWKFFELSKASSPFTQKADMESCGQVRQFEDTHSLINDMKQSGVYLNSHTYNITIQHLIHRSMENKVSISTFSEDEQLCWLQEASAWVTQIDFALIYCFYYIKLSMKERRGWIAIPLCRHSSIGWWIVLWGDLNEPLMMITLIVLLAVRKKT